MKYGDTLPQRSVLEWLPFNLDYNDICDLIKGRTVGRAPVTDPTIKSEFEDELFKILMEQLERIELFVKSKSGEIDRRIIHCSRLVAILASKDNLITPKRIAKYVKAENEIDRTGQDIQNLSRFVNAQYTGFLKLLKKYRKWTGSITLSERFLPVLEAPTSFHNRDFERHVVQMSELLGAVREKFNASVMASKAVPQTPTDLMTPLRTQLSFFDPDIPTPGTLKTDIDLALSLGTASNTLPWLPDIRCKAVFWVHTDYLIEIQVLLLKYLNLKSPVTPYPTAPPTPALSRRASATNLTGANLGYGKDEDVGSVVLDNLSEFAHSQSSSTVEQTSETGPAAKVRWCGNSKDSDASIVIGSIRDVQYSMRLKRKHIEGLIDHTAPLTVKDQREEGEKIKTWFAEHSDVVPLVKIEAKRTSFVSNERVWATIDRDIKMFKLGENWKGCISDVNRVETEKSATFPHAVLEVRWDGQEEPALVKELYQSHLVETVHGFSLDVHAVYVLHQPKEMSPPSWSHALSKDIRKTPTDRPRKESISRLVGSSTAPSSTSTVFVGSRVNDAAESTGTLVPTPQDMENMSSPASKRLLWSKKKTTLPKSETVWLGGERYWSEFNDEEEEDEPFTILVNPDTETETGERDGWFSKFLGKMKVFFSFTEDGEIHERQQLLPEMADSSDEDLEGRPRQSISQNYSTFSAHDQEIQSRVRERVLYRGYTLCFVASVLTLVITAAWAIGGNSKHEGSDFNTGLGEALCVFLSLVFAGYALSLFIARKDKVGLLHKFTVYGLFCLTCLGASFILAIVYNNSLRP